VTDEGAFAREWAARSGLELLQLWTKGAFPPPAHVEPVGLSLVEASEGRLVASWTPPPALANPLGIVHGGYLCLVCDDAAGLAAATLGDRFRPQLTLDLHVEFVRPAMTGATYRVEGTVAHGGRSRTVADAEVRDAQNRLLCRAHGSFTPHRDYDPSRPA
jgi:uncharacterized protein (TIGR00369 family)